MISVPDDFNSLSLSLTFPTDSSICLLHGSHNIIVKSQTQLLSNNNYSYCHKSHSPQTSAQLLYNYYFSILCCFQVLTTVLFTQFKNYYQWLHLLFISVSNKFLWILTPTFQSFPSCCPCFSCPCFSWGHSSFILNYYDNLFINLWIIRICTVSNGTLFCLAQAEDTFSYWLRNPYRTSR